MRQISVRALRSHWPSMAGVFLTMLLASGLIFASSVLMESGLRASDQSSATATLLPAVMGSFGGIAVMIAIFVVSSAFAAALRDRRREFALLRAVGATGQQVRTLVSTEVMIIALLALGLGGFVGFGGAHALTPLLRSSGVVDEDFALIFSPWSLLATAALLLPAAWLAGRLAAREMARLHPTAAVSTSTADARTLSRGRVIAAWVCLGTGLAATTTPVFVPGALGGATGASSALLFITAVALAGPELVQRGATWTAGRRLLHTHAASVLATANARGYSRRLTAAVVPLALLVSLGSIQAGTNSIVATAGAQELNEAIGGELVWQGPAGDSAQVTEVLAGTPGVTAVASTAAAPVRARIEAPDEDLPFLDDSLWEPMSLRSVGTGSDGLIDPGVSAGDLAELAGPDTVAVSRDALVLTGKGVGDPIDVRYPDGSQSRPTIVAIYDRGLGLGDLLVGDQGIPSAVATDVAPAVIVQTEPAETQAVAAAADASGFTLVPKADYVEAATASSTADIKLSNTLLLVLLAFIAIAALNALLIATRSRAGEFALLARLGATGSQLRTMLGIEAALVGVSAVVIGTATALPGLVSASLAMVRGFSLGVEPGMYAGLAGTALVIAFLGMSGARLRAQV